MPRIDIIQNEEELVGVELVAQAIVEISMSMQRINNSRLKQETVIELIHAHSKVARRDIRLVLNNLSELQNIWLKPEDE